MYYFCVSNNRVLRNQFGLFLALLLIQIPDHTFGQTNEGREFWFSFLEHRNPRENTKVVMITSRFNTRGTVSSPLGGFSQSFTVAANQVTILELPEFAETFGSETISDNGFKVTSDDLVSVYIHQYHSFRAEATVVLPVSSIGNEYYALSYQGYFTEGQIFPSQLIVVASEDDTNISIDLKGNTQSGKFAGQTINITLDAGQTYQIQGRDEYDDLSGSYIIGDQNFSVFCGARYTALNCFRSGRDNLLEQAFPVSTWGDRFVSAPFQTGINDIFRILASENGTEAEIIYQDGSSSSYRLNRGQFVEYEDSQHSFIQSNKPILVAQYMNQLQCGNGQNGDPSMLYLNSVLQIRDTVTLYNSSFQNIEDNFINIIFRTIDLDNVRFDNQPVSSLTSDIQLLGRNDEFASVTIQVGTGAHTITSTGCGVIAKAYGLGNFESYAYSGGARFSKINASPIPEGGCLNDTVFFDTGLPAERFAVQWVFGPGDTVTDHVFTKMYDQLGSFPADLFIHDQCFDLFDTLFKELQITLRQSVQTEPIDYFCQGEEAQLGATDVQNARYQWRGPNEYFSEDQNPIINDVRPNMNGTYQVIGIVSGCATFPAGVELEVKPAPEPELGDGGVFCPELAEPIKLTPGNFAEYFWSDGSTLDELVVFEEGMISVQVSDEFGCMASDSTFFEQKCPTKFTVPNIFSPNGDGQNDEIGFYGEDVISIDFKIYDVWGNEVFATTDQQEKWNGLYRNREAATGVYTWLLNLTGFREDGSVFTEKYTGTITLIR